MNSALPSVAQLVKRGEALLRESGVHNARKNAEWLLAHTLDCRLLDIYLAADDRPAPRAVERYRQLLRRRAGREPLQYILRSTEFMSLPFRIAPGVFIPRPDTEVLVETVERKLALTRGGGRQKILDLCCGCGVIAVSLAKRLPDVAATAVDVSAEAVGLSAENAAANGVGERVRCIHGEAAEFLRGDGETFDAVACNPPYVATALMETLPPEIRHEPQRSLDGGPEGLDFYRRVVPLLEKRLVPGGHAVFEIAETQGAAVTNIMRSAGFVDVDVTRDYGGLDRVVSGCLP